MEADVMRLHASVGLRPVDAPIVPAAEVARAARPRPFSLMRAAAVRAEAGPGAVRRALPSFPPRSADGVLVMPCGRSIG